MRTNRPVFDQVLDLLLCGSSLIAIEWNADTRYRVEKLGYGIRLSCQIVDDETGTFYTIYQNINSIDAEALAKAYDECDGFPNLNHYLEED